MEKTSPAIPNFILGSDDMRKDRKEQRTDLLRRFIIGEIVS